jgi:hypothetical protein
MCRIKARSNFIRAFSVVKCLSDAGKREWRFYLDDMIGFAERILTYTDGFERAGFVMSELTYDATLRNLELIGETATDSTTPPSNPTTVIRTTTATIQPNHRHSAPPPSFRA